MLKLVGLALGVLSEDQGATTDEHAVRQTNATRRIRSRHDDFEPSWEKLAAAAPIFKQV